MCASVNITQARIENLVAVHNSIPEFNATALAAECHKRCADRQHLLLLASVNKVPAGYLVAYDRYQDGSLYCWMVAVKPKYRRQGVLTSLMLAMGQWACERNFTEIKIKTRNQWFGMRAFLARSGYDVIGYSARDISSESRILLSKRLSC